ncbi:MAG: DNA gyrase subunit B [Phycisphaerae bacterium]|nr:DNA gyrase subunit B [Phycisphaerae bacterium]
MRDDVTAAAEQGGDIYDEKSIKVLEGLEAVRKRPAMYIGDTGIAGLHHLVYEVVDNSIDEAMASRCDKIDVRLTGDGGCVVTDNGSGMPVGPIEHSNPLLNGKSAVEVCMTVLHAGGKFERKGYKVSGGLHGVGVSVVNGLSERLEVQVNRDGGTYLMRFERGKVVSPLEQIGKTKERGTRVEFRPDREIFGDAEFRYDVLAARLRELAYLNEGVRITITDDVTSQEETFCFEQGLLEFMAHLNAGKAPLHKSIQLHAEDLDQGLVVDVVLQYHDGFSENVLCFANNIHNIDGGTHLSGFRSALTRTINAYARRSNLLKGNITPTGEDIREGLTAIISVKVPEPQFEAQTKVRLMNPEVSTMVEQTVNEQLANWLEERPAEAKRIAGKCAQAAQAREAARKARDLARKTVLSGGNLPNKLWDCSSRNAAETELYLVEGDSAAGPAKQGRESKTQAILPLRGKILNVEKARVDKMLSNEEVKAIITAIGCGIGQEDFDLSKCRYGKLIIMTDADVDGSHIRTLLLTFLFRHMRPLVDDGRVYIAQPPLYQITRKRKQEYLLNDRTLNQRLTEWGLSEAELIIREGSGRERSLTGGDLLRLMEILGKMERRARSLQRRGIVLEEFVRRHREPETGGLPTIRVILEGEEHLFYSEAEFAAFRTQAEERFGELKVVDAAAAAEVEESTDKGSAKKLLRSELAESTVLQEQFALLADYGLSVEDYFARRARRVTGDYEPAKFLLKSGPETVLELSNLAEFVAAIRQSGSQGVQLKRYKGLGEMNAEELWETTMDPEQRTLLRVTVSDADGEDDPEQFDIDAREADRVFSILMGDNVESRREFIETNASTVRNLDV